jgi:hypothetical protein
VKVSWDDSEGEHDDTADWDVISDLIDSLDGEDRTHVSLGEPEAHLVCGGSASGGLVLYVQLDGEIHQLLSSTAAGQETVELVAAGQPGDYPARFVVGLEPALRAARTFVEDSTLEPSVEWELQE